VTNSSFSLSWPLWEIHVLDESVDKNRMHKIGIESTYPTLTTLTFTSSQITRIKNQ